LQRFKEFQTEVEAIGKVRHPNIVTLRAYYWSFDEKLLIYDYIPNGSLSAAIHGMYSVRQLTLRFNNDFAMSSSIDSAVSGTNNYIFSFMS